MAIYQPTNITPSSFAGIGNGVVSVEDKISITWQVNGNSPLTAFSFSVMRNDAQSNVLYTSPIIQLSTPFYGKDSKGNPQFYTYNSNDTWAHLDMEVVNGSSYKLAITQYWGSNNENSVLQYSPSVFLTRTKPTLSLVGFSGGTLNVSSNKAAITATYSQAQGDAINWCQWIFATNNGQDIESEDELVIIEDTGEIYTGDLSFVCDGMRNGLIYYVKCTVQTQSGQIATTDWNEIVPSYSEETIDGSISTYWENDSSLLIDIGVASGVEIEGSASPNDQYGNFQNGILSLDPGYQINWDHRVDGTPISFQTPWTFVWSGTIFETTTDIITLYCGDSFELSVTIRNEMLVAISSDSTINLTILDLSGKLEEGASLYFDFDSSVVSVNYRSSSFQLVEDVNIPSSYMQEPITRIALNGNTTTTYIKVTNGINTDNSVDSFTLFLTQFSQSSINAIDFNAAFKNASLYRQYHNKLSRVFDITNISQIRDYGLRSNQPYSYEVFLFSDSGNGSQGILSQSVCKQLNSYYLMEATQDQNESNVYHVLNTWRFGNNINAGSVSNNNTPTWLTNFTPYRLRQPISRSGKSGTLQALLSNYNYEFGEYSDSYEMMESLYAASSSSNVFFLKDMKGNLYMVHISAPIVQMINTKTVVQQVSVSIPWEEVGNAENVMLIQLPTDAGWRGNMIAQVTFDVDVETGMLIATYPDQYYGSTFKIENDELIVVTPNGIPTDNLRNLQISNGSVVM